MIGFVALGSNLGDRRAILSAGLAGMRAAGVRVLAASSLWDTAAVGDVTGPRFLNMAARIASDRSPHGLLQALLAIERCHGRTRSVPNAPRTLDLDLLLFGELELEQPGLCVPHPRMWERAFVLGPLAEIAPDLVNPRSGLTVAQELQRLRLASPTEHPI